MGVYKLSGAGGLLTPRVNYTSMLAGNEAFVDSAYELIETHILASAAPSITFTSLATYASTYKHLQIRWVARSDRGTFSQDNLRLFLNGNTTNTDYDSHHLLASGASVAAEADVGDITASNQIARLTASQSQAGAFAAGVVDILDSYSTTKNKTIRTLAGQESQDSTGFTGRFISLASVLFNSTDSTTSVGFAPRHGTNLVAGSRFSIYGIRG